MSAATRSQPIFQIGLAIFSFSIVAIGVETAICAHWAHSLGPRLFVIPVIPWLPAIPWLDYLFAVLWVVCGLGLLLGRAGRMAALAFGTLLFLCALVLEVPKYAGHLGNMSLRTVVLEPVAIACVAFLLAGRLMIPARYLLALCLIVFGVDHFLALAAIASLLPSWIPWHVFWVAFFGVAFIASGLSIALRWQQRAGAFCLGLMFAIWVFTLHLPRVMGIYGIRGASTNPDEWSSLLIAAALWGGVWTLVRG